MMMNSTDTTSKKILILNGSLRGADGNSGAICKIAEEYLKEKVGATSSIFHLCDPKPTISEVYKLLSQADGFLVVTGTYWNNWGSPLQRFIEVITAFENSPAMFGKPVACAVSMDSVGGTEVAARIHAVFAGLGCWSPPCSTLVVSRVGQEAVDASRDEAETPNDDVWRIDDIVIILQNLVTATIFSKEAWVSWPHVELKIDEDEWPESGPLDMDTPKFI